MPLQTVAMASPELSFAIWLQQSRRSSPPPSQVQAVEASAAAVSTPMCRASEPTATPSTAAVATMHMTTKAPIRRSAALIAPNACPSRASVTPAAFFPMAAYRGAGRAERPAPQSATARPYTRASASVVHATVAQVVARPLVELGRGQLQQSPTIFGPGFHAHFSRLGLHSLNL